MYKITLDCDLMRYRDSGLYHYCLNLGRYVKEALDKEQEGRIAFYVPPTEKGSFGHESSCIIEKNVTFVGKGAFGKKRCFINIRRLEKIN